MDAAKPSSGAKPPTANDPGTASKPAEGAGASAAPKRPEQMFVVQKSGPAPSNPGSQRGTPACHPGAAGFHGFRPAVSPGTRPGQPAPGGQAAGGQEPGGQAPGTPQSATPAPAGQSAGVSVRPQPPAAGAANVPAP